MVEETMKIVKSCSGGVLNDEDQRRLQTSTDFGARDIDDDELKSMVVQRTSAQLGGSVRECYASIAEIAIEVVEEKLVDRLSAIQRELAASRRVREQERVEKARAKALAEKKAKELKEEEKQEEMVDDDDDDDVCFCFIVIAFDR